MAVAGAVLAGKFALCGCGFFGGADHLRVKHAVAGGFITVSFSGWNFCQPGIGNYLCSLGATGITIDCLLSRNLFFAYESGYYFACKSFNRNGCIHSYAESLTTCAIYC